MVLPGVRGGIESEGMMRILQQNRETTIGGFHVVVDEYDISLAYFAYKDDAEKFVLYPDLLAFVRRVAEADVTVEMIHREARDLVRRAEENGNG